MPHAHASGFPSPCIWLSDFLTPVVQDRRILNCSGAGAPELQRWAQCLPVGEQSRPGGLSYRQFPVFSPYRGCLSPRRCAIYETPSLYLSGLRGTGPRATVRGRFASPFRFARDRPSRYGVREVYLASQVCEGQALALRCEGGLLHLSGLRGTGPRATVCGRFA